jgi:hypothetical protein
MANPNSFAQRAFAAEPYDSVAAVLASKQITAALVGQTIHTKDGLAWRVVDSDPDIVHPVTGAGLEVIPVGGVISSAQYPDFDTFLSKAPAHKAPRYSVRLPDETDEMLGFYGFEDCIIEISGDVSATSVVDAVIRMTSCKRVNVAYSGTVDGSELAKIGLDKVSCEDVHVFGGYKVINIGNPSNATSVGLRHSGCTRCYFAEFVVGNVHGIVARGYYEGTPTSPSFGCGISDFEIDGVYGYGTGGTVDGDCIQVQQDVPANFTARKGTIKDWNWRAFKPQAPGCTFEDIVVDGSSARDKASVFTIFHPGTVIRNVRGVASQITNGFDVIASVPAGSYTLEDINLVLTGKPAGSTNGYLARVYIGAAAKGDWRSVKVSGDADFNLGANIIGPVNMDAGCEFIAPGSASRLELDPGSTVNGSLLSGGLHVISGSGHTIRGLRSTNGLYISSVDAIIDSPVIDTGGAGDSRVQLTNSAKRNRILFPRIKNINSGSATPVALAIQASAEGNVIVFPNIDPRNSDDTKNTQIVNNAGSANTIVRTAASVTDSVAADISGVNTKINDLLAKMRTAGLLAT